MTSDKASLVKWHEIELGAAANYINGRAFKPEEWEKTGLPIIRIQNLNDTSAAYNYSTKQYEPKYLVKKGDLLFAWAASLGAFIWNSDDAWLNQHIFKVEPHSFVDKKYLYYALCNIVNILFSKTHGSGMVHITKKPFMSTKIFLPDDLSEQQAIVHKIESLFASLDKGVACLKKAKEQLFSYRRSLLENIFNSNLNYGEGWKVVALTDVASCLDKQRIPINRDERKKREGSIPYYGANGIVGYIDDYIFNETLILVVEDETFVGRTKPFSYIISGKSWVNNHAHVLRSKINTQFLNYQLSYYPFVPLTTGTTGRKKLTQAALMKAPIKICSEKEQSRIVSEIETRFSACDAAEKQIEASLAKAELLRQSILKKAFSGELI